MGLYRPDRQDGQQADAGKLLGIFPWLAAVRVGSKWGFIDPTGKIAIPVQFDDTYSFAEGLASIKVGNKWGAIDRARTLSSSRSTSG